jgi:hypothetical protein
MSATIKWSPAVATAFVVAVLALPAVAAAMPASDGTGSAATPVVTSPGHAGEQPGGPVPATTAPQPVATDDGPNGAVPIILGGAVLILVVGFAGYALIGATSLRRPLRGQH